MYTLTIHDSMTDEEAGLVKKGYSCWNVVL